MQYKSQDGTIDDSIKRRTRITRGVGVMITYLKGDLFNSPAKILVNTVNTVGVMGKGIALEFKKQYPEMFYRYQQLCEENQLCVGNLFLWKKEKKWVLLFPTKKNWRNPSKLEYVEEGLKKFADNWDKLGADSVAFPRLGCGNGGLDWKDVQPLMEQYLKNIPLEIYIYVDNYVDAVPEHLQVSEIEQWLNGESDAEGYEKFHRQLKNRLAQDQSVLLDNGIKAEVEVLDDKFVINDGIEKEVNSAQLCVFWNYVRDVGVIADDEIPQEFSGFAKVFLGLMKSLRYVESVIVSGDGKEFAGESNAYQFVGN